MHKTEVPALKKHSDVGALVGLILSGIKRILGERLVGLYLYGSLVLGDFDYRISDIDLLAATGGELSEEEFNALGAMHNELIKNNPQWENRLEIAYLSAQALKTFKRQTSRAAIICAGRPFQFKESGQHWLIDWYIVRENGVALFGPPPETIIEPVSKKEFIRTVGEYAAKWSEFVADTVHSRSYQAYAILTMCRAFYAVESGEQMSKRKAALWAAEQLPEWSFLIRNALKWREASPDKSVNHEVTFPETKKFVNSVINRIRDQGLSSP